MSERAQYTMLWIAIAITLSDRAIAGAVPTPLWLAMWFVVGFAAAWHLTADE